MLLMHTQLIEEPDGGGGYTGGSIQPETAVPVNAVQTVTTELYEPRIAVAPTGSVDGCCGPPSTTQPPRPTVTATTPQPTTSTTPGSTSASTSTTGGIDSVLATLRPHAGLIAVVLAALALVVAVGKRSR